MGVWFGVGADDIAGHHTRSQLFCGNLRKAPDVRTGQPSAPQFGIRERVAPIAGIRERFFFHVPPFFKPAVPRPSPRETPEALP
jgi:hypothetical protein